MKELTHVDSENQIIALLKSNFQLRISNFLDLLTSALHDRFPHYTGVYLYLLEGDTLILSNFRGRPTEHTRIQIGAGICGRAARVKETVVVDDVARDAAYIACSVETRSEIVVPIMRGARVLGEIDIDSDVPAVFSADDRRFLEEVARLIEPRFP